MSNRKRTPKKDNEPTAFSNDKMAHRYYPKTVNQEKYLKSITENQVVFCTGPSGTGKTALAICLACEHLLEGKIDKIILTKPYVETGKGIGFLPGSISEKTLPYLTAFEEYLDLFLGIQQKRGLITEGKIEIIAMEFCRGVTFRSCYIILDEAQNASKEILTLMLTRIDDKSKLLINGDIKQTDLIGKFKSGLAEIVGKLRGVEGIECIEMNKSDILRAGIIRKILERLEND